MMTIPNLCIDSPRAHDIPDTWKLERFLYKSGATYDARRVWKVIEDGKLGKPLKERVELLVAIKEEMEYRLASGESLRSIYSYLSILKLFFVFLESKELSFSINKLIDNYLLYSEYLFIETHKSNASIKKVTAYDRASMLSTLFGAILEIPDRARLITRIRLKRSSNVQKAVSKNAEKQDLQKTFVLGGFLVELVKALSIEAIHGQLPIEFDFKTEQKVTPKKIILYGALQKDSKFLSLEESSLNSLQRQKVNLFKKKRQPVQSIEGTARKSFLALRVQAEFLIFIAQTGMNVAQAKKLGNDSLKYKPANENLSVTCYKARRGGEVNFQIYKSYKPFLKRYREFLAYFFPDAEFLFPCADGKNSLKNIAAIRKLANENKIGWVAPRQLRNTRVNWLLRRSGDEDITAELAQHSKQVLRANYERPSQQRAMVEVTQFWNKFDPIQQGELEGSIVAGFCNGQPEASEHKPGSIVNADCKSPSGCLWCKHRRDLDSEDYVWSLASMRYLKVIEAGRTFQRSLGPADLVIERLNEMLSWYKKSSKERAAWVAESEKKIEEGDYHPNWSGLIEFLE